jgi:hypothetical protein
MPIVNVRCNVQDDITKSSKMLHIATFVMTCVPRRGEMILVDSPTDHGVSGGIFTVREVLWLPFTDVVEMAVDPHEQSRRFF